MSDELTWQRDGNQWVFSDGTVLPVVSGGDGEPGTGGSGDAIAAAGQQALASAQAAIDPPAAPAAAPPPTPPPAAPTGGEDDSRFGEHAGYIRELRDEAARYRTEAKSFKDAFDGWDDDDRQVLLSMIPALRNDPVGTAQWWREQAELLAAQHGQPGPGQNGGGGNGGGNAGVEGGDDRPLTRAELQQILADHERQTAAARDQEAARATLYSDLTAAGYDPQSPVATMLMQSAYDEHQGDLTKAIEAWKARDQKLIDDYLAGRKQEAASSAKTPPQSGAGRETEPPVKPFSDAFSDRIRSRLAASNQ